MAGVAFIAALAVPQHARGQARLITGEGSCGTCRIHVTRRLVLGSRADSVVIPGPTRAAVGLNGTVYVLSDMLPTPGALIFDSAGGFRGVLGGQGRGPGEMGQALRLAITSNGELFLQDAFGTVHVFGANGHFIRSLSPVARALTNLAVVGDSVLTIVSRSRPRAAADRPVQLYDARSGGWIRGIGPRSGLMPGRAPTVANVALASSATLWLVSVPDELQRWTLDGRLLSTMVWDPGWLEFAGYPDLAADTGYVLHDVWQDPANGLLWVASVIDDPSFHDPLPAPERGRPLPRGWFGAARQNEAMNSIVTVVDPGRALVIAHLRIDQAIHEFLRDGRIVVMREAADGYQWIEILSLRLSGYGS